MAHAIDVIQEALSVLSGQKVCRGFGVGGNVSLDLPNLQPQIMPGQKTHSQSEKENEQADCDEVFAASPGEFRVTTIGDLSELISQPSG